MKFLVPLPPTCKRSDLSYILDRTDFTVHQKIDLVLEKHGPQPVPFDWSEIEKRWESIKHQFVDSEDEDVDNDKDIDFEDEDDDNDKNKEAGEEIGKVLGDVKDPGTVKRPPQVLPEGEPVCKMPRTDPQ